MYESVNFHEVHERVWSCRQSDYKQTAVNVSEISAIKEHITVCTGATREQHQIPRKSRDLCPTMTTWKNSFLNLGSWYLKTKGHQGVLERELCRRVWQWETCRTNSSDIQVISYGSWELELRYCKANKTWSNMTERKHPALPITKLIPCTDHCSVLSYGGTVANILVYNLYLFLPALSKKWEILWPSYISHWFKTWSLLVLWVPWK